MFHMNYFSHNGDTCISVLQFFSVWRFVTPTLVETSQCVPCVTKFVTTKSSTLLASLPRSHTYLIILQLSSLPYSCPFGVSIIHLYVISFKWASFQNIQNFQLLSLWFYISVHTELMYTSCIYRFIEGKEKSEERYYIPQPWWTKVLESTDISVQLHSSSPQISLNAYHRKNTVWPV